MAEWQYENPKATDTIEFAGMFIGLRSPAGISGLEKESEVIENRSMKLVNAESKIGKVSANSRSNPSTYYSYDELFNMTREAELTGKGIGFEAHHLLEKQFASKFQVDQSDIISVTLTPKWHRGVNASKIIGEGKNITGSITQRGAVKNSTPEQIWQAHRNVYERMGHTDWAEAIYDAYVKKLNIPYK